MRIILVLDEQKDTSNSVFFHTKFQQKFLELSFPQETSKLVTVPISFKRYHWIFNVWPWFWQFVSWKTDPYIWTFWLGYSEQFGSIFIHHLSVCWYAVGCSVHQSLVVSQGHSLLLLRSFEDAEEPCSVKTAGAPDSSFAMSPGSTTLPLFFCSLVPTPHFWDDRCPSVKQSGLSFCLWLLRESPPFLLLTFSSCHAGIVSSFFHPLSTAASLVAPEKTCEPNCNGLSK